MTNSKDVLDLCAFDPDEEESRGDFPFTGPGGASQIHQHEFEIDDSGNGETISTTVGPDHTHEIIDGNVLPCGEAMHIHSLEEDEGPTGVESDGEEDDDDDDDQDDD